MIVRTKFNTDLNQIARDIGIKSDFTYAGHARDGQNRYSGKLYPVSDKFRRLGFYETSAGNHARINAVCAHGHYEFMKALFEIDHEATVESSWTRSFGQRVTRYNLESMHDNNLYRNIGSIMNPAMYGELCICSGLYPFKEYKEKKIYPNKSGRTVEELDEKWNSGTFEPNPNTEDGSGPWEDPTTGCTDPNCSTHGKDS